MKGKRVYILVRSGGGGPTVLLGAFEDLLAAMAATTFPRIDDWMEDEATDAFLCVRPQAKLPMIPLTGQNAAELRTLRIYILELR